MNPDETILCIPRSAIPASWLTENGTSFDKETDFRNTFQYGNWSFLKRGNVETDTSWKQLIPYVIVVRSDESIMAYPRHGSESRLHGLYSIGAGGHVNDGDNQKGDLFSTLLAGARREIREELGFDPGTELVMKGLVNEEITSAGKVHLGVVFSLFAPDSFIPGLLPELAGARFLPVSDIQKLQLEHWSRLALSLLS